MTATPVKQFASKDIPKPQSFEDYDYEVAVLENGFSVLLVSSPKIDMAGCAIGVGIGSLNDPRDFQGLAHFCEHMLFMGTDKYPSEEEFSDYVAKGGGVNNAFTSDRATVYYAKVKPDFLEGLVDRLAGFLAAPLFVESAVDREVEAVNSEFQRNLQDDNRRKYDLFKYLSNKEHPFACFNTGNNETLRRLDKYSKKDQGQSLIDLRNALIQFHKEFYSPNVMSAVVMGNQPIRALRDMVFPRLGAIPNKNVKVQRGKEFGLPHLPFRPEDLEKVIKIVPVREAEKALDFRFIIADQFDFWKTKPASFLSHCIGHEGPGSLLAHLKAEGLATGLYAGVYIDDIGQSPFAVNVSATDKGITPDGIRLIGEALFMYLRMLRETGVPKWAVEEEQTLSRLRWQFRPMPSVEDLMTDAARTMIILPPELVFEAPYVTYEVDVPQILESLDQFECERLNLYVSSRSHEKECKLTEPIYGTKYCISPLEESWLEAWRGVEKMNSNTFNEKLKRLNMHLFKPNQFIPKQFSMKKGAAKPEDVPIKLAKTSHSIYHKQEARFKLPHFSLAAKIELPTCRPTMAELVSLLKGEECQTAAQAPSFSEASWIARYSAMAAFARCITESLNEETYDATLAGVQFALISTTELYSRGSVGLEVGCEGFDDKGGVIIKALLDRLASLDVNDQNVTIALESMKRRLSNRIKTMIPYLYALCKSYEILIPTLCTEEDLLKQLETLTCDHLRRLTTPNGKQIDPEMTRGGLIEGLVIGNVTSKEASSQYFSEDLWKDFVPAKPDMTAYEERAPSGQIDLGGAYTLMSSLKDEKYLRPVSSDFDHVRPMCFIHRARCPNPEEKSSAITLFIQSPDGSAEWTAISNLLQNWLSTKFFDELRTKEALGYAVTCTAREHCCNLSRVFLIQSQKGSDFVAERIANFLHQYLYQGCPDMTKVNPRLDEKEYEECRAGVIATLSEQPKELKALAQQYVTEIYSRRYCFDRRQKQVEYLKKLTFDDFKENLVHLLSRPYLMVTVEPDNKAKFDFDKGKLKHLRFVQLSNARSLQAELFVNQADKIDTVLSKI